MLAALSLVSTILLSACAGTPPSAEQRAASRDDLNPSGKPYVGPPGRLASFPTDTNRDPLFCHPEPPGTVCTRAQQP